MDATAEAPTETFKRIFLPELLVVLMGDEKGKGYLLANLLSRFFPAQNVTLIMVVVFSYFSPTGTGMYLTPAQCLLIGTVTMVLVPGLPLAYALWKGLISFNRSGRRERVVFYLIGLLGYLSASLIFTYYRSDPMAALSLSYLFVALACMLINFKWKISVHTAGIGGPAAALVYVYGLAGLPALVLAAALAWARVKLKAHTTAQAVAGAIVAAAVTLPVYLAFYPVHDPLFLISTSLYRMVNLLHPA